MLGRGTARTSPSAVLAASRDYPRCAVHCRICRPGPLPHHFHAVSRVSEVGRRKLAAPQRSWYSSTTLVSNMRATCTVLATVVVELLPCAKPTQIGEFCVELDDILSSSYTIAAAHHIKLYIQGHTTDTTALAFAHEVRRGYRRDAVTHPLTTLATCY